MSEKIVVHCPTADLWNKAIVKALAAGWYWEASIKISRWNNYQEETCLIIGGKYLMFSKRNVEEGNPIIPASEYLSEWEQVEDVESLWEFKVGNSVECISAAWGLKKGEIYTVKVSEINGEEALTDVADAKGRLYGKIFQSRFKLIKPNKTIKKETKVMDADIRKEFGKEEGNTLLNINEHFTPEVMRRMFMKKNHKDIVAECDHIQREKEMREAEDKS